MHEDIDISNNSGKAVNFYLARPNADEVQLDLFGDYKSNVALYPSFQEYFRTHKPPLLAVWGKNDPFFLPPGAEAFKRQPSRRASLADMPQNNELAPSISSFAST